MLTAPDLSRVGRMFSLSPGGRGEGVRLPLKAIGNKQRRRANRLVIPAFQPKLAERPMLSGRRLSLKNFALTGLIGLGCGFTIHSAAAQDFDFFEKKIRPMLAEHCYQCHSQQSGKTEGGLRLDTRAGWLKGGETGPAIVPGEPEKSPLIKAVRSSDKDPRMPPKDHRLAEAQIADLVAWVKMGAPDPRTNEVQRAAAVASKPSIDFAEARKAWAFHPPKTPLVPRVKNGTWPRSPIDHFILAKLEQQDLLPASAAGRRTLIRRASFDLTGLPPTPGEIDDFLADPSADAFAKVVDRLLGSPHYGERWARHWLDVARYTDSFDARGIGGEGDVPEAYRYRDWVVQAFNGDLPYDQFILNQFAGDLLPADAPGGFNTNGLIATGLFVIGEWGTGDADKEKMLTDIVDDQVDVTGRAFLGLTVACARCHDHKFDPIPTQDYYGLAGIFFSSHILPSPGAKTAGSPVLRLPLASAAELTARTNHALRVAELEKAIEKATDEQIAALAKQTLPETSRYLMAAVDYKHRPAAQANLTLADFAAKSGDAFHPIPELLRQWVDYLGGSDLALMTKPVREINGIAGLHGFRNAKGADTPSVTVNANDQPVSFITITLPPRSLAVHPSPQSGVAVGWKSPITGRVQIHGRVADADDKCGNGIAWTLDLRSGDRSRELASGAIENGGAQELGPASKPPAKTPDAAGTPLIVEVKPGEIIQLVILPKGDYSCDTTVVELEIAEQDAPKRAWNLSREVVPDLHAGGGGNPHSDAFGNKEVWHFYDMAKAAKAGEAPPDSKLAKWIRAAESFSAGDTARLEVETAASALQQSLEELQQSASASPPSLNTNSPDSKLYAELTNPRSAFWSAARSDPTLLTPVSRETLAKLSSELAALKQTPLPPIPVAHGLQEGGTPKSAHEGIHDARVHIRGRYDRLGDLVARHFPRILAGEDQPPISEGSGRLQLARWIASPDNPLTARVMVNRLWQHHFGEGIVRTPNNYGKLGAPPTHPELLDYLAGEFVKSGWSIKAMHRAIMLSAAYQQSSSADPATLKADPDNLLFGRMNRRRLESEAIRDSLLAVSDSLDRATGGPAIRDLNTKRRTLYVMTVRSDRATYQSLFDAADPVAIVEKRIDSTVAPQALFMLNHPFALAQTKALAGRALKQAPPGPAAKIEWLYHLLYGRPPTDQEKQIGLAAVEQTFASDAAGQPVPAEQAWEQYCQVLLCANEFVYVE